MGPDLELKGRSEIVMEALANKENGSVVEEPETRTMRCTSNYEDNTFEMEPTLNEQIDEPHRGEDTDVNITECTNSAETLLVQAECEDATESSSSFSNSGSGVHNGGILSDAEVMSEPRGDNTSALAFDGFGDLFRMRKKRLTSHWRTFIQPLMWRCKWVELQIKKFQSQAKNYDTELAEMNQRKQCRLENLKSEGIGGKSLPFSNNCRREKVMQRKKRKRVEDTTDVAAYMSHHNMFSYYENRRSTTDAALMDNDWGNRAIPADTRINGINVGVNDELSALEFRDGDNSMEQILWKIGVVKSQVISMKTRLNKVISENAEKLSSADKLGLLVPCNGLNSLAQNPTSPANNGDGMPVGSSQLKQEYIMGDPVVPGSAVSSHGEVSHLPDMIERTDQHQAGGLCENTEDRILIYNRRAKEELDNFEEVQNRPVQSVQLPKQELEENPEPPLDLLTDDQSTPKIRSISKITAPKIKRKRGRRKAGSGRWSRRTSG
ncbi:hypothetical protein LguiA_019293 [Lonicera macranthoides]